MAPEILQTDSKAKEDNEIQSFFSRKKKVIVILRDGGNLLEWPLKRPLMWSISSSAKNNVEIQAINLDLCPAQMDFGQQKSIQG